MNSEYADFPMLTPADLTEIQKAQKVYDQLAHEQKTIVDDLQSRAFDAEPKHQEWMNRKERRKAMALQRRAARRQWRREQKRNVRGDGTSENEVDVA